MEKVVLFDIDGTLFDREKYLSKFYELLASDFKLADSEIQSVRNFYEAIKIEFGFFNNQAFLERIYKNYPKLSSKLDFYFTSENLDKFIYIDAKVLYELKNVRIGIFSKGDRQFQRLKIAKFENVLEKKLIFIEHNKLKILPEIISQLSDSEVFIIDDSLQVLITVKDIDKNIKTIQIDRDGKLQKPNGVDFKLKNLSDIIAILE